MTDELLIKFLLNETDEDESIAVQEWIAAGSANQAYYNQFEKIWNAGKKLASVSKTDTEQAWAKFKERSEMETDKPVNKPVTVKQLQQNFSWLKIAAVLVLITGIWLTYSLFGPSGYKELTAGTEVITKQLPDGSELTLNKNSVLSYAADFKAHRNVKLKRGNVFFSVAHDKTRPFVISIDKVSVTVVGTSFNIKHLNSKTEVIVETGIVKVALNSDAIELHKGEKVEINGSSSRLIKENNTDQLYNYYRSKLFVASNTPLQKLADVLNEAYGAEIVIHDPVLAAEPVNTTLIVSKSLDENLKTICETLKLKMERNNNKILLSAIE